MSQDPKTKEGNPQVVESSRQFFAELVERAADQRRLNALPFTKSYIVNLLDHFMLTVNLFEQAGEATGARQQTMAEMFLRAASAEPPVKIELLKKLGDTALYISGFFGDSLHRKLIDIDYYVEIGGSAYGTLATVSHQDTQARVFKELSAHFSDYVDLLTYISQKAMVQTDADLLRLYNRYILTGSKLAEEQLIEKGVLTTNASAKAGRQ